MSWEECKTWAVALAKPTRHDSSLAKSVLARVVSKRVGFGEGENRESQSAASELHGRLDDDEGVPPAAAAVPGGRVAGALRASLAIGSQCQASYPIRAQLPTPSAPLPTKVNEFHAAKINDKGRKRTASNTKVSATGLTPTATRLRPFGAGAMCHKVKGLRCLAAMCRYQCLAGEGSKERKLFFGRSLA